MEIFGFSFCRFFRKIYLAIWQQTRYNSLWPDNGQTITYLEEISDEQS